ncbi:MAG TPA: DUF5683 domain-containing protein [Bacteroidia bacterium]|nr:DUF5683 domain-containing protein [Bacteroidia bacterium]HNP99278.1 DUF5683 domain-containing protein [Bacteroidia bacterium]
MKSSRVFPTRRVEHMYCRQENLRPLHIALKVLCFLFIASLLSSESVRASDTDSLTVLSKKRANRTALSSAILPGLGQGLNKKYWKIPVIYAGFGSLVYFIQFNEGYYKKFKTAFLYRNDSDPSTVDNYPLFSNDDLRVRKDYYRRNRDLCYILTGVLYSMNIIDAYVDAQLMDFDVSDNLSIHTTPSIESAPGMEAMAGLKITFNFK